MRPALTPNKDNASKRRAAPVRRVLLHRIVRKAIFWDHLPYTVQATLRQAINRVLAIGGYAVSKDKQVTRPKSTDYSISVPFEFKNAPPVHPPKLGVICHLYHEDVAAEIARYLTNITLPFALFVSTDSHAKKDVIERQLTGSVARVAFEVRVTENRGRDIAPKLITFRDVYEQFELVLFLHSKRSDHRRALKNWRKFLLENLVGSPAVVDSIVAAFTRFPDLGIVASQHFEPIRSAINWGNNFHIAAQFCERIGLTLAPDHVLDFPSGSMFWARTRAIRPVLNLQLSLQDFDVEAGQTDGTAAHAIERLFFHVCERAGYNWIKVVQSKKLADRSAVIKVSSPEELVDFMNTKLLKLTRT